MEFLLIKPNKNKMLISSDGLAKSKNTLEGCYTFKTNPEKIKSRGKLKNLGGKMDPCLLSNTTNASPDTLKNRVMTL